MKCKLLSRFLDFFLHHSMGSLKKDIYVLTIKTWDHDFPRVVPRGVTAAEIREDELGLTVWQTNLRPLCKMCCHYHGNRVRCDPVQLQLLLPPPHPGESRRSKSKYCTGLTNSKAMHFGWDLTNRTWKGRSQAWGETGKSENSVERSPVTQVYNCLVVKSLKWRVFAL